MPTTPRRGGGEPSAGLQPPPQRRGLDEVREGTLAVDLDDGDRRPVGGLERGVAADVDTLEVARTHLLDDLEHALAQVTTRRVVDDDPGAGYG